MSAVVQVVMCPRDNVETALRCSRCENPICPKCLVMTPVGARCKDCAQVAKSPIYTLQARHYVRAGAASVVGGLIMGAVWWAILLPFSVGFLSIFVGAGLGYAFTRLLDFATGRKRGPVVVAFASVGIGIAWGVLAVLGGLDVARFALIAVAVGVYFAYMNLRSL
ncbi:MAG: hypothetical protein WEC33_04415 [Dehalococcoidia bacterium]